MTEGSALVLDLLTYIEQVEKLKYKPAFTVPAEFFAVYQHELKGLPELQFNIQGQGSDVWLRIPRLREIAPPQPDGELGRWITLSKTPAKVPELKTQIEIRDAKHPEGSELLRDHPEVTELFHRYLENQWQPWAAAEGPRRKTIKRYNELFSLQQTISTEGSETPLELVWGLGYALWKKEGFATVLKHPLISQSCEVTLNDRNFDLEIKPRDTDPRIELDTYAEMEIPGVRQLEAFWKGAIENGANRPNPFEASTYEGVLKAAVGHLDKSGAYEALTDDTTPPPPGETLKITNSWVLYARKRTGGPFLDDVKRLRKAVETANVLPAVVRNFVERGGMLIQEQVLKAFRGLSTSENTGDAMELYFPMAYNDEQISIVQKLERGNGVVVQGPPGTGKTHTIANIICHYLAQGKRVLVTSRGESALNEVIGKLPERIRPLCVGLLSNESDGMKKFEHSIQTIAANVSAMNASRAHAEIVSLQERLDQLHAKISHVDRQVSTYAAQHMRSYIFQGQEVSPEEMAKIVMSQADEHQWLDDDVPEQEDGRLPFNESDISALRLGRLKVGRDLLYLKCSVPAADDFPPWEVLAELHRDLGRSKAIDADLVVGAVLKLKDSTLETFEGAKRLMDFLDSRLALQKKLTQPCEPALEQITRHLGDMRADDPLLLHLMDACADVRNLEARRKELVGKAVVVPADAEASEDFLEAVRRLCDGKSAFALPFGKGSARKLLASVTVLGSAPATSQDWVLIQELLDWRVGAKKSIARWNSIATEFGIAPQRGSLDAACKAIAPMQRFIEDTHLLAFSYDGKLHAEVEKVFGKQAADGVWDSVEATLKVVTESLHAHVDKGRLAYAMGRVREITKKLDGRSGMVVNDIRKFLTESLGSDRADEAELHKAWLLLQSELSRVVSLRSALAEVASATDLIESAGAKKWAARLRTEAAGPDYDALTPSSWPEAWKWRCAVLFLEKIDGHQRLRDLFAQRKVLTTALARTYQDLVAEKTWLGVYNNSPPAIRQALQAYLNSIQAMGAGTGVRAIRLAVAPAKQC